MIGNPCSLRFTPDSNRTPKPFRSDSGTYHLRRTVGLGPGHIVLDGDPASTQKGHSPQMLPIYTFTLT